MPRRKSPVKSKRNGFELGKSSGAVDIHFHGAFGIDLMTASPSELRELAKKLWHEHGVAGFCPTTLSTHPKALLESVTRLGRWVRNTSDGASENDGAVPLGIHLEGPFIHEGNCGAHPPGSIRKLDFAELDRLWKASLETLKILTIAPEMLTPARLTRLTDWAKQRGISLSLGHSHATESQALEAFAAGFRGVTHAWNALGFHHRSPGPLGAALGNDDVYVELIVDQVHVAPSVIRWTQALHSPERLCMISDCVPAAETTGRKAYSFGPLKVKYAGGACRLRNGALAGGGKIVTRSFGEWLVAEPRTENDIRKAFSRMIPSITKAPLWAIGEPVSRFAGRQIRWIVDTNGRVQARPDSAID